MRSGVSEIKPDPEVDLPAILVRCQADAEMAAGLRHIYDALDRAIADLATNAGTVGRVVCLGGGGCCKFDLSGHRLWVTVGELSLVTTRPPSTGLQNFFLPQRPGGLPTGVARGIPPFHRRPARKPLHPIYLRGDGQPRHTIICR